MKFKDYTTADQIIDYLKKPFSRTGGIKKNESYVYHYTCYEKMLLMLKSKTFWLSSPQGLNDQHEYTQFPKEIWEGMYLASFVGQEEESMAMWSMYGKKWEQAVKIAFRADLFEEAMLKGNKKYVKNNSTIDELIPESEQNDYFSSIAYIRNTKRNKMLQCGTVANTKVLKSEQEFLPNQFVGFVKDIVWSYEKEVRFVVKVDPKISNNKYKKIEVDLGYESAKELWKTVEITPSPNFTGDLLERLRNDGYENFIVKKNKFENKITGTDSCSSCKYRESCYAKL